MAGSALDVVLLALVIKNGSVAMVCGKKCCGDCTGCAWQGRGQFFARQLK